MSDTLHQELTSLREATKKAVLDSYREHERLCRDGEMMQMQISYLKAKIEAAKNELVLQGKLQPQPNTDAVPVIEEEGEISSSDSNSDDNSRDDDKPAKHRESSTRQPTSRNSSIDLGMPGLSRSSMLSMLGTGSSFAANSTPSQNSLSRESMSGSMPRFSVFDEVGMPSRWKAREMERQKQREEEEADSAQKEDDGDGNAVDDDAATGSGENELINKVQRLISQRESEIKILEKQTQKMETETATFHNKMSDMQKDHESTMTVAKRERDALLKGIQRLEQENEKLDAMILETRILLQEKEISGSLLEKELREARNELYDLQGIKKANRKKSRSKGKPSSLPAQQQTVMTHSENITCQVPLNDLDDGDRRGKLARRGSSSSVMSANSAMSALTLDFDDIVDILDASKHSVSDMDDFGFLLDSLRNDEED